MIFINRLTTVLSNGFKVMTIYRLVVKGNVTDVGFRITAKKIARRLKIRGYARNIEDDVELFCMTDEETLSEFEKRLLNQNVKEPNIDLFGFFIEDIDSFTEGDDGYIKPEYEVNKPFRIEHEIEEDVRVFDKEMLNRLEAGTGILQSKFHVLDTRYDRISNSIDHLAFFYKAFGLATGGGIILILLALVYVIIAAP